MGKRKVLERQRQRRERAILTERFQSLVKAGVRPEIAILSVPQLKEICSCGLPKNSHYKMCEVCSKAESSEKKTELARREKRYKKKKKKTKPSRIVETCDCGNSCKKGKIQCVSCLKKMRSAASKKKKNKPAKKGKRKNRFKFSLSGIDLKPYSDRNEICRDLGFKSYDDYTNGKLWKSIRLRVFQSHGRVCQFCKKSANQIHHSKYTKDNLSGESLRHLHPICGDCHQSAEFDEQGNKRTLKKCNEILGISPA